MQQKSLRNLAIIAHVDHGKTTLLDKILEQSGTFDKKKPPEERVMDSNPLEKERGITILSKCTSFEYKNRKINVVDTPGHADFGGEVERVLNMVDGVLLLVDAFEGPMPQTKFVTQKALSLGLKLILVINKIDRDGARPDHVLDMIFDLFVELGASEDQLEFSHIYTSAKEGFAQFELNDPKKDLLPLFDLILQDIPQPKAQYGEPFQMLITDIQYDNFLGRLLLGRINRGKISSNTNVTRITHKGDLISRKVTRIFQFEGLKRIEVKHAGAGDIVLLAGMPEGAIGETITDPVLPEALPIIHIDPPTISMNFRVNDSPFSGQEGKYVTGRQVRNRLQRELLQNVSLKVEDTESSDDFKVSGRGELHLGILIENMRREGYEFSVSRPKVIYTNIDDKLYEPMEELFLEIPEVSMGPVMEELGNRKADIKKIDQAGKSIKIEGCIPTRGLISYRSQFLTMTKGEGIMYHSFLDYQPYKGETSTRKHGVLIAMEKGDAVAYAICKLQDRGNFFISPNTPVYEGMIVGCNSRNQDLGINVCAKKKLNNVRASGKDDAIIIIPHIHFSLEQALEFIEDDELIEVTPKNIRLRKRLLTKTERRLSSKRTLSA